MITQFPSPSPAARLSRFALLSALFLSSSVALAKGDALPPRSQWKATSSSLLVPALAAAHAIDGDLKTHWGGAFSADHWLQVDMGKVAEVGGVLLHWDSGFAVSYAIQTSVDGKRGMTLTSAATRVDSPTICSSPKPKRATCVWPACPRLRTGACRYFEFEPLSAQRGGAHRQSGRQRQCASAVRATHRRARCRPRARQPGTRELDIALGRATADRRPGSLVGRAARRRETGRPRGFRQMDPAGARIPDRRAIISNLAAPEVHTLSALRLTRGRDRWRARLIKRLRLLGPERMMTPTRRYEVAASRANSRTVSLVAAPAAGVLDGGRHSRRHAEVDLRRVRQPGSLQGRADGAAAVARRVGPHASSPTTSSARIRCATAGCRCPRCSGSRSRACAMRSEAIAVEQNGQPVTLTRHRISNTEPAPHRRRARAARAAVAGRIRRGSTAASRRSAKSPSKARPVAPTCASTAACCLPSLTPADARGAAAFGAHGEGEITSHVAAGTVPRSLRASDADGLAAALLDYASEARAGRTPRRGAGVSARHLARATPRPSALPEAPAIDRAALVGAKGDASAGFDALADAGRASSGSALRQARPVAARPRRWSTCCARRSPTC